MPKKPEAHELKENQKEFITKRVKELGSYDEVCKVYNLKDLVTEFARNLAEEIYGVEPSKKEPKKRKKAKTVKKKRKIDTDALDDDES